MIVCIIVGKISKENSKSWTKQNKRNSKQMMSSSSLKADLIEQVLVQKYSLLMRKKSTPLNQIAHINFKELSWKPCKDWTKATLS